MRYYKSDANSDQKYSSHVDINLQLDKYNEDELRKEITETGKIIQKYIEEYNLKYAKSFTPAGILLKRKINERKEYYELLRKQFQLMKNEYGV